jgi:hypothetical protein
VLYGGRVMVQANASSGGETCDDIAYFSIYFNIYKELNQFNLLGEIVIEHFSVLYSRDNDVPLDFLFGELGYGLN